MSSAEGLIGAAYVGLVEMGVAFVFWLSALRLSENTALAERVLRARTRSGRSTVVVPRFRGGDLRGPVAVRTHAGAGPHTICERAVL